MKKAFFLVLVGLLLSSTFLIFTSVKAQPTDEQLSAEIKNGDKVPIEVFERLDCVHCQAEKAFFTELKLRRDDFTVRFHDIGRSEHYGHWKTLTELEGLPKVTPITIVGNTIIQGFSSVETTGAYIEKLIDSRKGKENLTFEEFIAKGGSSNIETFDSGTCDGDSVVCEIGTEAVPLMVSLPFIGPLDVAKYSLPALAVVLGFIDGFNPCAMWVLVTFLIILMQVGSKKRMWQIAGLFIFAEAIMYYLILTVWFTAWDFVGLDNIITPVVGLVAIGGGIFFLYEWKKSDGTCKLIDYDKKSKTASKIKNFVSSPFNIGTAVGIVGLAFSVNVIEFACSIGIPQAFTKIIELNNLSWLTSQWYVALYILFYMIDDLIVFGIALYSFEKIGITTKYSKWSNLIGGILMILLGLILIFKRQWLIF